MKTVKVKAKCSICKYEIEFEIEETIMMGKTNGIFQIPDAYCPECLCVMEQIIDHHKKDE